MLAVSAAVPACTWCQWFPISSEFWHAKKGLQDLAALKVSSGSRSRRSRRRSSSSSRRRRGGGGGGGGGGAATDQIGRVARVAFELALGPNSLKVPIWPVFLTVR